VATQAASKISKHQAVASAARQYIPVMASLKLSGKRVQLPWGTIVIMGLMGGKKETPDFLGQP